MNLLYSTTGKSFTGWKPGLNNVLTFRLLREEACIHYHRDHFDCPGMPSVPKVGTSNVRLTSEKTNDQAHNMLFQRFNGSSAF
jgi:hypothetical protein